MATSEKPAFRGNRKKNKFFSGDGYILASPTPLYEGVV